MEKMYFSYYIVTYDIANPKRLKKVADIIKKYINRRERSVYDGELSPSRFKQLKKEIKDTIDENVDHCTIIPLTEFCRKNMSTIGIPLFDYKHESSSGII